jgi:serralysin
MLGGRSCRIRSGEGSTPALLLNQASQVEDYRGESSGFHSQTPLGCGCAQCAGPGGGEGAGDGLAGLPGDKPVQSLDWIITNFSRNNAKWAPGSTITYSFRESLPPGAKPGTDFQAYGTTERMFAKMGFDLISDVCNLTFVEAPDDGLAFGVGNRIYFGHDTTKDPNTPTAWGFGNGWAPGGKITSGQVWSYLENVNARPWIVGGFNFQILMHEQLHTLGVPHAGKYDIFNGGTIGYATHAEYAQDSTQYTIMSYFAASNTGADHFADSEAGFFSGSTPMLHDVAALQALYGANMSTRTGDTVYGYNSNTGRASYTIVPGSSRADTSVNTVPIFTIWDAGGRDLIDFSLTGFAVNLDLRAGHFSDAFEMTNNISIAHGVVIEDAFSGSADDRISGNAAGNHLRGGAGNDSLYGQEGDDQIGGQEGDDFIDGGSGRDTLFGDAGRDHMIGGADDDRLHGQDGDDLIGGQDGDDFIDGGNGRDLLFGDGGRDHMVGGADDDRLFGQDGDDLIGGQGGADFIDGGAGRDTLYGDDGNDVIMGGEGADFLFGQAGADLFVFLALSDSFGPVRDRIFDFNSAEGDIIDISAIDADANLAGDQAFTLVGGFSGQIGQAVLSFDASLNTTTLSLDANGDGVADFVLDINGNVSAGLVL